MVRVLDFDDAGWEITEGMAVYACDGEEVGRVRGYDPRAGYLDVHQDWLFGADLEVPLEQVDVVLKGGVVLTAFKEGLAAACLGAHRPRAEGGRHGG